MSKSLILELTDDDYRAVENAAQAAGKTVADWVTTVLRDQAPVARQTALDVEVAPNHYESEYELLLQQTARQMAAKYGGTPQEHLSAWRVHIRPKLHTELREEEREAARQRLYRHLGAVESGDADSADNDRIDEDLAREY